MITDLLNFTAVAFLCAVSGFVYTTILTDPGEIFDNLYSFLQRRFEATRPKLFKVLIGCERCVSGQLALWTLVFLMVKNYLYYVLQSGGPPVTREDQLQLFLEIFHPLDFIYTISAAVFFAYLISNFYQWTRKKKS